MPRIRLLPKLKSNDQASPFGHRYLHQFVTPEGFPGSSVQGGTDQIRPKVTLALQEQSSDERDAPVALVEVQFIDTAVGEEEQVGRPVRRADDQSAFMDLRED